MHTSILSPAPQHRSHPAADRRSASSPTESSPKRISEAVYAVSHSPCVHAVLSVLRDRDGVEVVGFGSAAEFLESVRTDQSSCLILDLPCSDREDLEMHCQLAARSSPPVIFICGHSDICSAVRAMKAGAIELLTMPVDPCVLIEAIRAAIAHDRRLRKKRAELADLRDRVALLTPREREVLPLIVGGLLNKQAAHVLGISEVTLQIHRSQVMRKIQAESLPDLVRMAAKLHIPFWCGKQAEKNAPLEFPAFTKHQSPRRLQPRAG
jgi:FixJ family two-component response regulator